MTAENKSTKVETTTSKDGDNNIITTTTTTEEVFEDEPEKLDFDFDPNKQLNEALEKQRREEREAIQGLIDENVRLDRAATKAKEDAQEYKAKYAALQIKYDELLAGKESSSKTSVETSQNQQQEQQHVGYDDRALEVERYRLQVRDLELRLQQLAADDRAKDKVIQNLTNQGVELQRYSMELEKELGEDGVELVKARMAARGKGDEAGLRAQKVVDRSQIVRQGQAQSKICSIM